MRLFLMGIVVSMLVGCGGEPRGPVSIQCLEDTDCMGARLVCGAGAKCGLGYREGNVCSTSDHCAPTASCDFEAQVCTLRD